MQFHRIEQFRWLLAAEKLGVISQWTFNPCSEYIAKTEEIMSLFLNPHSKMQSWAALNER